MHFEKEYSNRHIKQVSIKINDRDNEGRRTIQSSGFINKNIGILDNHSAMSLEIRRLVALYPLPIFCFRLIQYKGAQMPYA